MRFRYFQEKESNIRLQVVEVEKGSYKKGKSYNFHSNVPHDEILSDIMEYLLNKGVISSE